MPKYKFKAVNKENKKIVGTFVADDEEDLKMLIAHQDYYLISYRKIAESTQFFGFLEKIRTADFTMFCRQFAIMLAAGLSVDQTVQFLSRSTQNKKLKDILVVVYTDLLKGKMLSESFNKYPKTFPAFFRNMIKIGEESGNLSLIFKRLADYYEDEQALRKKVISSLSYPIFLIVLVFVALLVISIFVMPKFEAVFSQFNGELPMITQIMMAITGFIKNNILLILLFIIAMFFLFTILNKFVFWRRFVDKQKLTLPILKNINIAVVTSRFASSFAILLDSGIKIIDALSISAKLLNNLIVEDKLMIVKNEVQAGSTISKSLTTINLFPQMLVEMVAVGEQTSSLEEVLNKTTKYFDERVDSELKAATAAIQPILLMIVGGVVAALLLSIFLPMLGLMSAIETSAA